MIAFTRVDSRPILERGVVTSPGLIVVADESLLTDPLVRPLQGLSSTGRVLINSPEHDFTKLALSHTGSVSALSVAHGAAAAKLAGLEDPFIEQAVREELQALGLNKARLEKNLELARASIAVGAAVGALYERPGRAQTAPTGIPAQIVTPAYQGPWAGTASVASQPNTPLRKTGDWRLMRPAIDLESCTHCWICFVNCPDGAIALTEDDVPQIDYGVCKGCLICIEECPIQAIESVREAELR